MAAKAISFNPSVLPVLMITITVVIAPGPVSKAMAIGNTVISYLLLASLISSSVTLSGGAFAYNMCKATIKSNMPPATLKESTVIPKNLNMSSPDIAKITAIRNALITDLLAMYLLSFSLIPEVRDMKVISPPIGFTIVNSETNA